MPFTLPFSNLWHRRRSRNDTAIEAAITQQSTVNPSSGHTAFRQTTPRGARLLHPSTEINRTINDTSRGTLPRRPRRDDMPTVSHVPCYWGQVIENPGFEPPRNEHHALPGCALTERFERYGQTRYPEGFENSEDAADPYGERYNPFTRQRPANSPPLPLSRTISPAPAVSPARHSTATASPPPALQAHLPPRERPSADPAHPGEDESAGEYGGEDGYVHLDAAVGIPHGAYEASSPYFGPTIPEHSISPISSIYEEDTHTEQDPPFWPARGSSAAHERYMAEVRRFEALPSPDYWPCSPSYSGLEHDESPASGSQRDGDEVEEYHTPDPSDMGESPSPTPHSSPFRPYRPDSADGLDWHDTVEVTPAPSSPDYLLYAPYPFSPVEAAAGLSSPSYRPGTPMPYSAADPADDEEFPSFRPPTPYSYGMFGVPAAASSPRYQPDSPISYDKISVADEDDFPAFRPPTPYPYGMFDLPAVSSSPGYRPDSPRSYSAVYAASFATTMNNLWTDPEPEPVSPFSQQSLSPPHGMTVEPEPFNGATWWHFVPLAEPTPQHVGVRAPVLDYTDEPRPSTDLAAVYTSDQARYRDEGRRPLKRAMESDSSPAKRLKVSQSPTDRILIKSLPAKKRVKASQSPSDRFFFRALPAKKRVPAFVMPAAWPEMDLQFGAAMY